MTIKMRDAVDLDDVQGAGWQSVDDALREISKRRGALDGLEARWLREALRVKIWRELGYVSMADYLERRLGYAPRTASDRVRVAMALEDLPQIAKALEGGLPHSAVRELTRVATRENEKTWLDAARGKSVHEIEELVSGRGRGSNPGDPKNPSLAGRTLPFEGIRPSTEASLRDARRKLQDERGGGEVLTDDEVLAALTRHFLEGERGERTKAPYQIAVTLCEHCGRGWQQSGGRKHELSAAEIARACCDAERIGSLDGDAPERAAQDVTPAMRRFVYRRDGGRCRVPGCRSTRCLEIHHIVARILGGSHEAENLILICDGCHAALHRGLITISGTSSELVVVRRNGVTYVPTDVEASADAFGEAATERADLEISDGAGVLEQTPFAGVHSVSTLPPHDEAVDARTTTFVTAADRSRIGPADHALAEAALAAGAPVQASQTFAAPTLAEIASAHVGTNSPQRSTSAISGDEPEREKRRVDARAALVGLGYRLGEAGEAVDLALRRQGDGRLEDIIREALRSFAHTARH